ncbi:MAG: replication initiation protein [Candidatus Saccharibacteria bacterium]|nr:replication initiation protein [Rhodoferax sp.]
MRHHENDQPCLFASGELHIPEALKNYSKPIAILHAVPTHANHAQNLNSRRLFDACILVAQLDYRKRSRVQIAQMQQTRISPLFEVNIGELVRLAGIPGKNYERIYKELDRLFEMVLNWNIVGEDNTITWENKSHFLASVGYGSGHFRGQIRFSIDPAVLQLILEPSIWAQLSLQALEGLSTAASYALYQNCWRYIGTHAKVTASLPTHTWIELLVGPSRFVTTEKDGTKRATGYGDFKRRVLLDAIRRVNESPALNHTLKLIELRNGKRITKLQFKFVPKSQASLGLPLTWSEDLLQTLKSIGFSETEIEDLSQAHSIEVVSKSLNRLKAAEQRLKGAGKPISSHKAYFNGILSNMADGAPGGDLNDEKIEEEARAAEAQRLALERSERLKKEFSRHQADVFAARLFEMSAASRREILDAMEGGDMGQKAKMLLSQSKEWSPKSVGALSLLRSWLGKERPEVLEQLLIQPEDNSFESWMMWRLEVAERPANS